MTHTDAIPARGLLYTLTFLTGASGLIYQVVWQRFLSRMLGAETLATGLILALFLAGLAAGYLIFGAVSRHLRRPVLGYAAVEGIVAGWGLLFPAIYTTVYTLTLNWSFAPPFALLGQGFVASLVLIGVPTVCMGATVPMLTRGLATTLGIAPRTHATLYAVNTFGACAGTLLAGFFLIERLGLSATVHFAAALNLIAASGFFLISRRLPDAPLHDPQPATTAVDPPRLTTPFSTPQLLLVAFLSGAYVMTLENVLIRVMNISLGSSTYSFTVVVAVFILAIATGSAVVGRLRRPAAALLYWNQFWILTSMLFVFMTIDKWPQAAHIIRTAFQSGMSGFILFQIAVFAALLLVLIVPIALMGATVPIAFGELRRELRQVGWHSGLLLGVNGVGCLLGSLLGGVLMFVWVDIGGAYLGAAVLAAASLTTAAFALGKERIALALGMVAITALFCIKLPFFDSQRFVLGTFRMRGEVPHTYSAPAQFYRQHLFGYHVPWHETGPSNTVGVLEIRTDEHPSGVYRALIANGRSESVAGGSDQPTISLLAHIPALFAERRESVLVIGLGTGVTAAELTLYDEFETIAVAEISTSVANALPWFEPYLHDLRQDPRFDLRMGDALRILRRREAQWDIIISEPSNPFITGVDQLFTFEFYNLVREKLSPNGIFMQWLQVYDTTPEIIAMINLTLMSQFANLYYFEGAPGDLLILATDQPLGAADRQRAETVLNANPRARESMATFGVESLDDILDRMQPGVLPLVTHFQTKTIETEDHPRLHYLAGRAFFRGDSVTDMIHQLSEEDPLAQALAHRYSGNWESANPIPVFRNLPELITLLAADDDDEQDPGSDEPADSADDAEPGDLSEWFEQ